MFSYLSPEERIPADHPLRQIRMMVDVALKALSPTFDRMYADFGRPSIAPEKLLRALLLQILYTVRSEQLLLEQLQYNLLFRWFVGLNMDEPVWVPTVFSKNRERLLAGDVAKKFFAQVLEQASAADLTSDEHFSVDGTLIEAWAGQKSFQRKDQKKQPPSDDPGNPTVNFHGEERSNQTHQSRTDPDARLARKSGGHESKLAYCGNVLMENRNGLVVDTELKPCSGTAERDAAILMADRIAGTGRVNRRSLRLAKDGGNAAEGQTPRAAQSGLGVHVCCSGVQSGTDAKPAVRLRHIRIGGGISVPIGQNRR
jgi:transposase